MATVNIRFSMDVPTGNNINSAGKYFEPYTITVSQVNDNTHVIPTATTKIVLNLGAASTDDLADFDILFIQADTVIYVELKGTTAADNSNFAIAANQPFLLTNDDTRAYNAAGAFAGAVQAITQVSIRNVSGGDSTVRVIAAT